LNHYKIENLSTFTSDKYYFSVDHLFVLTLVNILKKQMDDSFSGDLGCTIGRGLERERTLDRLKRKRKTPLPENMVVVFFYHPLNIH